MADAGKLASSQDDKDVGDNVLRPRKRWSLMQTMAIFYFRLSVTLAPLIGVTGLFGKSLTKVSYLVILAVLGRRWLRCYRGLPSGSCTSQGKPLEPTMEGLHRRFLELFTDASGLKDGSLAEVAVLKLLQFQTLKDGQQIAYWDMGPKDAKETVVLVNGLGGRVACWVPFFDALHSCSSVWKQRRIVIPEYRGQFASMPLCGSLIAVERSAEDVLELTAALHIERATLLCWSTGVQVGLEVALKRPNLPKALLLIQGTTGQALEALGQPFCPVFGMPALLSLALQMLPAAMQRSGWREVMHKTMVTHETLICQLGSWLLWVFGTDLQAVIAPRYVRDMLQSDAHFANYCGYALALGRHQPLPKLKTIQIPSLVVTGTPDFVTPARCSYQLYALLGGHAELFDDVGASHYFIYEEPHKLASRVHAFLEQELGSIEPSAPS